MSIRQVGYGHPDAAALTAEVQQLYVVIYGTPDESPVDSEEFSAPLGAFFLAYDENAVPVAMGGWRLTGKAGVPGAAAELKRMYVRPSARGRGYARGMLAHLEATAAVAGAEWLVLETGTRQPEAIALYTSAGYASVPRFGHYADSPGAVHLGKQLS